MATDKEIDAIHDLFDDLMHLEDPNLVDEEIIKQLKKIIDLDKLLSISTATLAMKSKLKNRELVNNLIRLWKDDWKTDLLFGLE